LTLLLSGTKNSKTASASGGSKGEGVHYRQFKRPLSKVIEAYFSADVLVSTFYVSVAQTINNQGEGVSVFSPDDLRIHLFNSQQITVTDFAPYRPPLPGADVGAPKAEVKSAWGNPNPPPEPPKDDGGDSTLGKVGVEDGIELFVSVVNQESSQQTKDTKQKKQHKKTQSQSQKEVFSLSQLECFYRQDIVRVCAITPRTTNSKVFEMTLSVPSATTLYEFKFQALECLAQQNGSALM
jgi:hypothetical protein